MFNNYDWELYLKAGGQEVADKFERYLVQDVSAQYADFISELHSVYCPSKSIQTEIKEQVSGAIADLNKGVPFLNQEEYSIRTAMEELELFFTDILAYTPSEKETFQMFSGNMAYLTTILACALPDLFIPYYFLCNYNVLNEIACEFDIDLPPIPQKKDYQERFYFYGVICGALIEFRDAHNLSPYELWAFLYDFTPNHIGGYSSYIIQDLPKPRSAFFIGGHKNDAFLTDDPDIITPWQCNPDTRAGDMVVMYLRSPISSVDSVWRSVSVGFYDPFFFYYRCTYIARPEKLAKVSQKELKQDEVFKDLPIIRKNMQGINGVELKPSEYNHLLELGKASAKIPRLEFSTPSENQQFTNEKDVENKLIKPLISKLGYADTDYEQQLYIKVGNHNRLLIPDFVLLPNRRKEHSSAFAIIEAKYSLPNKKALKETKIQARSYAVQLKAEYYVIASKECILVYGETDDFSKARFAHTWGELKQADVFSSLVKLIGKQ